MKIAILGHQFTLTGGGGVENYLREVSSRLIADGHNVKVFARRWPENDQSNKVNNVPVNLMEFIPPTGIQLLKKPIAMVTQLTKWLKIQLTDFAPDLILCRFAPMGLGALRSGISAPLIFIPPAVEVVQNMFGVQKDPLKDRFFRWWWRSHEDNIYSELLSGCNKIMTFSLMMKRQISEHYKISPTKVVVNPPGVNTERFSPKDTFLKKPECLILYVGRLAPEKGLLPLFRCITENLEKGRWKLLSIGDGPEKSLLETLANKSNGRIQLKGFSSDIQNLYKEADIFILPSLYEPFGQVITEAMSTGLPVIARKGFSQEVMTAADEIVEDGRSGLLVNGDSPLKFLKAIDRLAQEPEKRKLFGQRGIEIINERFTWKRHNSQLMQIAQSLM
jgi:glycosyltransferase involved in cell wall biosynthesis